MRLALAVVVGLALSSNLCLGVEGPALEVGKTLFEASNLGSNGKSCASCHPEGKGLTEVAAYDDGMLREMVNFCIRDALKGKMLSADAQELEALMRYVRSFEKP